MMKRNKRRRSVILLYLELSLGSASSDPKQTSGGTGSSDLARQVRHISDQLALGIHAARKPYLPQMLPMLLQSLLLDDLPPEMATPLPERTHDKGVGTVGATGVLPGGRKPAATVPLSADAARVPLVCALLHVVGDVPLRWHTAGDLDACAGERAPYNWCVSASATRCLHDDGPESLP